LPNNLSTEQLCIYYGKITESVQLSFFLILSAELFPNTLRNLVAY